MKFNNGNRSIDKEFELTIMDYIYKGKANLFKGFEGVGGDLYLTKCDLIHKPHNLNIQSKETVISLNDIASVSSRNTIGIIPNGLSIKMNDDKEYKFVVYKRNLWIEKINSLLK